jgi:hypothetical protein
MLCSPQLSLPTSLHSNYPEQPLTRGPSFTEGSTTTTFFPTNSTAFLFFEDPAAVCWLEEDVSQIQVTAFAG